MSFKLDDNQVKVIMRALDDGYQNQEESGYPPYALVSWHDRTRYRAYVEKVLKRILIPEAESKKLSLP